MFQQSYSRAPPRTFPICLRHFDHIQQPFRSQRASTYARSSPLAPCLQTQRLPCLLQKSFSAHSCSSRNITLPMALTLHDLRGTAFIQELSQLRLSPAQAPLFLPKSPKMRPSFCSHTTVKASAILFSLILALRIKNLSYQVLIICQSALLLS